LVRTCVDRLAREGITTVESEMEEVPVKGLHRLEVRDKNGGVSEAVLELKYRRLRVLPPVGKQKQYPPLMLTVIHAQERGTPKGRERIDWKLLTDLPVVSRQDAIEKLTWYSLRWKIEVFHKVLKSGCKVQESRLRTASRLVNLIATCCVLAWRIFWMTVINRSQPAAASTMALTQLELDLLDHLAKSQPERTLSRYLSQIARLGGYLARAHDPPPGNIVMWRGLSRLTDITLGYSIRAENVGN
jgi:hypothetical protein